MTTEHQAKIERWRTRKRRMQAMRAKGDSLGKIATKFNITRQRVAQILSEKEQA